MKKFFTAIPLQGRFDLKKYIYEPVGNSRLHYDKLNSFPILSALNGYVQPGEEIEVIAVATDNGDVNRNRGLFEEAVKALCEEKGILLPKGVEYVNIPENEDVQTLLNIFLGLTDYVEDHDELFACMTYGTKPMSTALMMAVQYAYRIKQDVCIGGVVYGKVTRREGQPDKAEVYDMTALIQMNELVYTLAAQHVENPRVFLDMLLKQ